MPDTCFVTHLECSATGEHHAADKHWNLSRAGKPLLVRYDLEGVARHLTRESLREREPSWWRYRELLPMREAASAISLGEVITPLVGLPRVARDLGLADVLVKDEGRLPTGSFKARGLALAVTMAHEFGVREMAIPTNGNAGAAMAAYCARAGIGAVAVCPDDTPEINVREIAAQGARVYRVNGLIDDCGKLVAQGEASRGWFNCSTLKEPYRIEGKKTMGLELAEQLGWVLPDVIFYPTGGGTGLIGMWKAFDEMEALGWIASRRPRMVAVQASGCAPIVRAYEQGVEHAQRWSDAQTIAMGIRVPAALGDFLILRAVRASGGTALAVDDEALEQALDACGRRAGLLLCPDGAATLAALHQARRQGLVCEGERVVLFNCADGHKYPLRAADAWIDRHQDLDFASL